MIARALACCLLVCSCAVAQLQVSLVEGQSERAIKSLVDIGAAEAGDALDAVLRVRNTGPAPAALEKVSVAGAGFSLVRAPALPAMIASGQAIDFVVRFQPAADGRYSADVTVNGVSFFLWAEARPGAILLLDWNGARVALSSGTAVEFGSVQCDAKATRRFVLENSSSATVSVAVSVSGVGFRGPAGIESPVELSPHASAVFDIAFEPQKSGAAEGTLQINQRSFPLRGTGVEPPPPKPQILFEPPTLRSGQQAKVLVRFASPVRASASGRIWIELVPAIAGVRNDAAIQFLSTGTRSAEFEVKPGSNSATFGGRPDIGFQTGTTAGSLVFTAECGGQAAQAVVPVLPAPVTLDGKRAARNGGGLEVQLTGFDNTRSVSKLAFTFFDRSGRAIDPGRIEVDAGAEFRRYFDGSDLGGMFALRMLFPVEGDASDVAEVEVELTNTAGTARSGRVPF